MHRRDGLVLRLILPTLAIGSAAWAPHALRSAAAEAAAREAPVPAVLAQVDPEDEPDDEEEELELPDTLDVAPTPPPSESKQPPPPPSAPDSVRSGQMILTAPDSTELESAAPGDTLFPPGERTRGVPPPPPPKPRRSGIFGIHPAALLIGVAALHYFVIKMATD